MNIKNLFLASMLGLNISGVALADTPKDSVKAAFVYVGPVGDHGWSYRHDVARKELEDTFGDRLTTTFLENVGEGADAERVFTSLALQGNDIIFGTSFGYMDAMATVAAKFPNVKFEHATGYKQGPNFANYGLKLYQARHIQGIVAGMMTKTNKICYVASFPIPEVAREINTFYLGAKKMNPDVKLQIVWVYTWYDPSIEADAAKAMIDQGCDVLAQHTDSPAPLQTAETMGVHGFGQASDQSAFAPRAQYTGTIDNWGPYYTTRIQQVLDGTWTTGDYFGDISEGAVGMAPFANLPDDVIATATAIRDQISAGTYFAFTGPLNKQDGTVFLAKGEVATRLQLDTMDFYVEGVEGKFPN